MERFLKPGEGFLVARVIRFVLQFEGILAQVIKLVFRSMMQFVHEGFGPIVFLGPRNPGCGEVETLGTGVFLLDHFQGLAQADVGSDAFVVGVVDQAELTVAYRAYGVDPFTVVDDTAVGEGAEDVFAGLLELLPSEQGKKAHAVARGGSRVPPAASTRVGVTSAVETKSLTTDPGRVTPAQRMTNPVRNPLS